MKIKRFSKFFVPAAVLSVILCASGIAGYFALGGFNLGVDFQAGLIQEVQFAPKAFGITWNGRGTASLSFDSGNLYVVISGAGVESRTIRFALADYKNLPALTGAMKTQVDGLGIVDQAAADVNPQWLVHSAQGNPQLGSEPYIVYYLTPDSPAIPISTVREALTPLGRTVSVQQMGAPAERHFMIRLETSDKDGDEVPAEKIIETLEAYPGLGSLAVLRSDFVGSRFSKNLSDQAGILLTLTLLLILAYASIRFKPQYAVGAVVAIVHDALIMVAFITFSRMEFNTTSIAAILTILGYSINNTIVIFDRMRENHRIYPDDVFVTVLDRSLFETLSRSIITTLTTMLAVASLFIFTTGSIHDFAAAVLVGLVSGAYSSMFIAPSLVNFWENRKNSGRANKVKKAAKAEAAKA